MGIQLNLRTFSPPTINPLPLPPGPQEQSYTVKWERREKEGFPGHRATSLPDSQAVTSLAGDTVERTEKHNNKGETQLLGIHLRVKWGEGGRSTDLAN